MLLAFGADFLETWLSPVEYARRFKDMHAFRDRRKGFFCQVSPYQALTGANADAWLPCRPGTEFAVVMGLTIAIFVDNQDSRILDRRRAERLLDVPVLGSVSAVRESDARG